MSELKKPPRKHVKGLAFSSASQKRRQDEDNSGSIFTVKRHHPDQEGATYSSGDFMKTSFLVLSDTHGKARLPQPLPEDISVDVVLHCGDLSECGDVSWFTGVLYFDP
jgi:hypothetical protein